MNRFLKAPMTERLCRWNSEGEDIVGNMAKTSYTAKTHNGNRARVDILQKSTSDYTSGGEKAISASSSRAMSWLHMMQ